MSDPINEQFEKGTGEIDQIKSQMLIQEIRDNQNLLFGTIGGIVAAAIGASIWAVITALTNFQIGWMAVGVGFLVGYAVRIFGKGIDKSFGAVAAILSLAGCLAGNLLTACIVISQKIGEKIGGQVYNIRLSMDWWGGTIRMNDGENRRWGDRG